MILKTLRQSILTYVRRGIQYASGLFPELNIPLKTSLVPSIGAPTPTFTRTTTGTVKDFEEVLHTAKINELRFPEQRRVENLLRYSSDFSNSAWVKQSVTIDTNTVVAPDGTLTAYKMVSIVGTSTGIYQIPTSYNISVNHIFSVYAKASGKDTFALSWNGSGTTAFNLSTGEASGTGGIEAVGDGWYRCYIKASRTTTGQSLTIRFSDTAGDGTSGIYLWKAQLEQVRGTQTLPSENVVTSELSWPYHGCGVDGVKYFNTDRSGNTLESKGALVEPAATNQFLYSTVPVTRTVTVVSGSKYVIWGEGTGSVVLSGAGTGTVTEDNPVTITASSTSLVCTVSSMTFVQVELNIKTSHIITTSAAVTRTADVLYYPVSDIITQGQGSLYFEVNPISYSTTGAVYIISLSDGTSSNAMYIYIESSGNISCLLYSGGVSQASIYLGTFSTVLKKIIIAFRDNDLKVVMDGVVKSDILCDIPNFTKINIIGSPSDSGQGNALIKNVKYFKEVLSESECIRRTA